MSDSEIFEREAKRLSALAIGSGRAFWFDIDIVELSLLSRFYGKEKENEFVASLESFLKTLPGIGVCQKIRAGRYVFDILTEAPYSDREIVLFWKDRAFKFVQEKQPEYPDFCIRISCGICEMPSDGDFREAIENAAFARKESRQNRSYKPVVYTSKLLENLHSHQKKEIEIRQALFDDRFIYYLQPIVDLETGCIVGAEALARCVTPEGTIKYPDSFLPVMEQNGSVIDLDFLILRKVCRHLKERMEQGLPVVCTSINLSRLHLEEDTTADTLLSIAKEYHIPPELLNFELTETLPLDEFSKAKTLIDELRNRNFRVSIDDYGSGYTGITVWQDLDFDMLKMDKKFLSDDAALKMRNTVLIPNTIDLAKKMNINVVCEGVEQKEHCRSLLDWGCHTAQGFYFSRPTPVEDFYRHYEESNGRYPLNFIV